MTITGVRLISRTVDNGRVSFNQVVMDQQEPPAGIMLVAIDPDAGLYVWLRPHDSLAEHTIAQAPGYSQMLPPFAIEDPPDYLGPPVFFPKETIAGWDEIAGKQTNTLNRAIRDLFGVGD